MRTNNLTCDNCTTTLPVVDPHMLRIMPEGWLVLTMKQGYLGEKEAHFCSTSCLGKWAVKQAPAKINENE